MSDQGIELQPKSENIGKNVITTFYEQLEGHKPNESDIDSIYKPFTRFWDSLGTIGNKDQTNIFNLIDQPIHKRLDTVGGGIINAMRIIPIAADYTFFRHIDPNVDIDTRVNLTVKSMCRELDSGNPNIDLIHDFTSHIESFFPSTTILPRYNSLITVAKFILSQTHDPRSEYSYAYGNTSSVPSRSPNLNFGDFGCGPNISLAAALLNVQSNDVNFDGTDNVTTDEAKYYLARKINDPEIKDHFHPHIFGFDRQFSPNEMNELHAHRWAIASAYENYRLSVQNQISLMQGALVAGVGSYDREYHQLDFGYTYNPNSMPDEINNYQKKLDFAFASIAITYAGNPERRKAAFTSISSTLKPGGVLFIYDTRSLFNDVSQDALMKELSMDGGTRIWTVIRSSVDSNKFLIVPMGEGHATDNGTADSGRGITVYPDSFDVLKKALDYSSWENQVKNNIHVEEIRLNQPNWSLDRPESKIYSIYINDTLLESAIPQNIQKI
jgi:hypothetical protein